MGEAGITETQLWACLDAVDGAPPESSVSASTRALARTGAEDVASVLRLVERLGYISLSTTATGAVSTVAVTSAGHRLLVALRSVG